jgi:hypothetical protein
MKEKLKEAIILGVIQIVLYSILCMNFRAVAEAHYHEAALTDFLIASMNFFIIKKIAQSTDTFYQWVGYVVGSVIGSYIGIYLSVLISS